MSAAELFTDLRRQGLRLRISGEDIRCVGPKDKLTPELAQTLNAHKSELMELLHDMNRLRKPWDDIAATGLTDMQVIALDDALFLFALRKIQKATTSGLPAIWNHHSPYWRRRLVPVAWQVVLDEYEQRQKRPRQHQGQTC
jgi:hypothetical protein